MATHSLPEPYKLELHGGGSYTFHTYEDIEDWAAKELEAWSSLVDRPSTKQLSGPYQRFPSEQYSHIDDLLNLVRDAISSDDKSEEKLPAIKNYLDVISGNFYPTSRSAQGQLVLRKWQQNPDTASAMLAILRGELPIDDTTGAAVRASALMAAHEVGYDAIIEDEKTSLELLAKDFSQRSDKEHQRQLNAADQCEAVNKKLEAIYDDARTEFRETLTSHGEQMDAIRESFKTELSLRQPAKYWSNKAYWHWAGAALGFAGLLCTATSVGGLVIWGPELLLSKELIREFQYGGALLIAFPAFALFWIMKAFSRVFVTNLQLLGDARLRSVMVTTFVSLMENPKNQMSEEDRILILQALFRPAGVEGQDESPPNWFDVLLRRMDSRGN